MLPIPLVPEVVAPLVVLEVFQPPVLSPLVRLLSIMSAPSVMPLIIACLPVLFGFTSIVTSEVLVIISPIVSKTLPVEILVLSQLLEFSLLLSPLLH